MKRNLNIISIIILTIVVSSSFSLLLINNSNTSINLGDYFIQKEVSGIVEGTTQMFDTFAYLQDNPLEKFSTVVQINSQLRDKMSISIGYKSINYDLLSIPSSKGEIEARRDCKEIELWSGSDSFPGHSKSLLISDTTEKSHDYGINMEWNLLGIGFTNEDYVKADERIWYLKIQGKNDIVQGIEEVETIILENGTVITYNEFIPYENSIKKFELHINDLIFETQFYPYFDGTTDIIIPIRAVNHELKEMKEVLNDNYSNKKAWYDQTTIPGYNLNKDKWCVVFATCKFKYWNDMQFPGAEGSGFILGSEARDYSYSIDSWQYLGVIDYGWSVIYCMDQYTGVDHPLDTVTYTYDSYFNGMITEANSKVGSGDELMVLVLGHGGNDGGKHYTPTYQTKYTWHYVIKRDEYRSYMDDITNDGTYVFLHISACNGNGFSSWDATYHNNRLAIWTYIPTGLTQSVSTNNWETFHWRPEPDVKPLGGIFKESYNGDHITNIGNQYEDTCNLIIASQNYWGSYQFRLRGDFDVDDFHQFWQQTDEEISSTKTDSQIQFTYSASMGGDDYILETYLLLYAETDDNFYVEITADWSVYSGNTIWHTLLEVGFYDYDIDSFSREMAVGTRDSWNGNYGYFRSYSGGTWYNTGEYGEVGASKTDVRYIIQRSGTIIYIYLVQGYTYLLYKVHSLPSAAAVNSIRLWYKHHSDYLLGSSSWTIKTIDIDINY
ncbi:MAG: hypothetical protein FK733_10125 [Asgard group archaeon]|nr:hypothetical protein [Asgard group archaeon]